MQTPGQELDNTIMGLKGAIEYYDRTMKTTEAEITNARGRTEHAYARPQKAMDNHQKQIKNMLRAADAATQVAEAEVKKLPPPHYRRS